MKNQRKFAVVIERDEDGYYVGTVPTLRGCHSQAKTLDALMKRVREAVQLCLESEDRTNLGSRFEKLRYVIDRVADPDRLGICADTCHIFAAGARSTPTGRVRSRD